MAVEKINTLSGYPQGWESGLSSREEGGVSTCISSRPLQELLKGPFCPHVGLAHILVRLGKQGEKKCGAASKPWRPGQVTTGAAD